MKYFKIILLSTALTLIPACDENMWDETLNELEGPAVYALRDKGPGGGYVFYITDGGMHGLEIAPVDQELSGDYTLEWGNTALNENGNNNTIPPELTGIGDGAINTEWIKNNHSAELSTTYLAFKACIDYRGGGYDDWFLPSTDELNAIYVNLVAYGLGGFPSTTASVYWSSSENSTSNADFQSFYNGSQSNTIKSNTRRVRAVRAF